MKFKFEKLIIGEKAMEYGEIMFMKKNSKSTMEYAFNLMNMMVAFKEKIE